MQAAVIFTSDSHHWLASRLREGYQHVFCVVPSVNADNISVLVDLSTVGIDVRAISGTPEEAAATYRIYGYEALLVPYRPAERGRTTAVMNNCVGLTKQVIGFRSWALTPWQLRQALLKETNTCAST